MLEVDFFIHHRRTFGQEYLVGGVIQLYVFPSFANRFNVKVRLFVMVWVIWRLRIMGFWVRVVYSHLGKDL